MRKGLFANMIISMFQYLFCPIYHNASTYFEISFVSIKICEYSGMCNINFSMQASRNHELYKMLFHLNIKLLFPFNQKRWNNDPFLSIAINFLKEFVKWDYQSYYISRWENMKENWSLLTLIFLTKHS